MDEDDPTWLYNVYVLDFTRLTKMCGFIRTAQFFLCAFKKPDLTVAILLCWESFLTTWKNTRTKKTAMFSLCIVSFNKKRSSN